MSQSDVCEEFNRAFEALANFLSVSLPENKLISLPAAIVDPFHRLGGPADSNQLQKLTKLFAGRNKDAAIKLAPRAFYAIFTIALSFPFSRAQHRLLHIFLDVITVYTDENKAAKKLSRYTEKEVSTDAVRAGRQFICQKLVHHISAILVDTNKDVKEKQMAAEMVSGLLLVDKHVVNSLKTNAFKECLREVLCNGTDYLLRILVANIIREMVYQRAVDLEDLLAGYPTQSCSSTLASAKANSCWINDLIISLEDIDATRICSTSPDKMFRLRSLQLADSMHNDCTRDGLVIISTSIALILPTTKGHGGLSVIEIPFKVGMEVEESEENTNTVGVNFVAADGDYYCRGVRKAINGFQVTLLQADDRDDLVATLLQCSADATTTKSRSTSVSNTSPLPRARKQSIIFATMDWRSEDDHWMQEGEDTNQGPNYNCISECDDEELSDTSMDDVVGEKTTTPQVFRSNARHDTTLNKILEGTQLNESTAPSDKQTPRASDIDPDLAQYEEPELESPTLRRSQPLASQGVLPMDPTEAQGMTKLPIHEHRKAGNCEGDGETASAAGKADLELDRNQKHVMQRQKPDTPTATVDTSLATNEFGPGETRENPSRISKRRILHNADDKDNESQGNGHNRVIASTHKGAVVDTRMKVTTEDEEYGRHQRTHKHKGKRQKVTDKSRNPTLTPEHYENRPTQDFASKVPGHTNSNAQEALPDFNPDIHSASILDDITGASQRRSGDDQSLVEHPRSPPSHKNKMTRYKTVNETRFIQREDEDEVVAQDSYPLDTNMSTADPSNASFAAKLSEMLDITTHPTDSSRSVTKTPFGNRSKFVASVNAARSTPHRKSANKNASSKPPSHAMGKFVKSKSKGAQGGRKARSQKAAETLPADTPSVVVKTHDDLQIKNDDIVLHLEEGDQRPQLHPTKTKSSVSLATRSPAMIQPMEQNGKETVLTSTNQQVKRSHSTVVEVATGSKSSANVSEKGNHKRTPVRKAPKNMRKSTGLIDKQQGENKALEEAVTPRSTVAPRTPPQKILSAKLGHRRLSTSKPQIAHFSKDGPTNQCKMLNEIKRSQATVHSNSGDLRKTTSTPRPRTSISVQAEGDTVDIDPTRDDDDMVLVVDDADVAVASEEGNASVESIKEVPLARGFQMRLPPQSEIEERPAGTLNSCSDQPLGTIKPPLSVHDRQCNALTSDLNELQFPQEKRFDTRPELSTDTGDHAVRASFIGLDTNPKPLSAIVTTSIKTRTTDVSTIPALSDNLNQQQGSCDRKSSTKLTTHPVKKPTDPSVVPAKPDSRRSTITADIIESSKPANDKITATIPIEPITLLTAKLYARGWRDISATTALISGGSRPERMIRTVPAATKSMLPPPHPTTTQPRTSPTKNISKSQDHQSKANTMAPIHQGVKRAPVEAASNTASPKRARRSTPRMVHESNSPFATPASFSLTVMKDLKEAQNALQHKDKDVENPVSLFKDNDTTLLDSKKIAIEHRSTLWDNATVSSSSSSSGPDLEGTLASEYHDSDKENEIPRTKAHSGLRNVLSGLTEAIVFRFGREEKAIHTRAAAYSDQANAMLDRIHRNWNESVKHEKQVLLKELGAEQADLSSVIATLEARDHILQKDGVLSRAQELIGERKKSLLHMLQPMLV